MLYFPTALLKWSLNNDNYDDIITSLLDTTVPKAYQHSYTSKIIWYTIHGYILCFQRQLQRITPNALCSAMIHSTCCHGIRYYCYRRLPPALLMPLLNPYPAATGLPQPTSTVETPLVGNFFSRSVKNTGCRVDASNTLGAACLGACGGVWKESGSGSGSGGIASI